MSVFHIQLTFEQCGVQDLGVQAHTVKIHVSVKLALCPGTNQKHYMCKDVIYCSYTYVYLFIHIGESLGGCIPKY